MKSRNSSRAGDFILAKPVLAPGDSIEIKVECLSGLLLEQLDRDIRLHARPQERGRQKKFRKPCIIPDGLRVDRSSRCTERSRWCNPAVALKGTLAADTLTYEFDHALGRGKLVRRLATRANFGSAPAIGHRPRCNSRQFDI